MAAPTSQICSRFLTAAPLNARYWTSFGLLAGVYILDFFDFFLIAFILAVIGPSWHLTYGQAALILYGSGVGAIVGALVWGSLSDVFGRKLQTVTGTLICGVAGGLIGFLPNGAFVLLAILRFFVGFGLAAAITPALTIIVELTPTRWRSGLTSLFVAAASLGPLSASLTSHALLRALGWRGVAMFGLLPILIGVAGVGVRAGIGAVARGQGPAERGPRGGREAFGDAARPLAAAGGASGKGAARQPRRALCRSAAVLADDIDLGRLDHRGLWLSAVGADHRRPCPAQSRCREAAKYFIYVSICAIVGRLLVALIAQKLGRRRLGIAAAFAAAVFLGLAGYFNAVIVGGLPMFVVLVAASAFFVDGGLEQHRTLYDRAVRGAASGARASGLGHAAAGIGKILGPLSLAVIAGTRQRAVAAGDGGGGIPGVSVSGRLHAGGRAGVPVPRARDAWPGDGARPRRRARASRPAAAVR